MLMLDLSSAHDEFFIYCGFTIYKYKAFFFGLSKMMFSSFNVMPKLIELSVHGRVPPFLTVGLKKKNN